MRTSSKKASETSAKTRTSPRLVRFALCIMVFLIAFGVRVLIWHDTRLEVGKVQTTVTANYQNFAQLFRQEGIRGFFSPASPLADTTHLGHPPGYSFVIALVQSTTAVQFVQITFDALCAVLIFLIVSELGSAGAGLIAGLLAAFSPQLAWNSVLLLPDSLSVFPVLLAVYLLVVARRRPRLLWFFITGLLIGVSCWFRANALLMAVFFAGAVALIFKSRNWWRNSLAVVFGAILILAPLTLRNAIVFHRFIPVSLGAGQTLLEGIADYDEAKRFGIPETDIGIQEQEAKVFQRPDYYTGLLNPDGIQRERWRLQRGLKVISEHPVWFGGVMVQRAASMLRLERAHLVSPNPALTQSLEAGGSPPTAVNGSQGFMWTYYPRLLIHGIQRMLITAVILPLAILGLVILTLRQQREALIILSVVPVYYFLVQSIFHTEYRYFLAINFFLFSFAAMAIWWVGNLLVRLVKTRFLPSGTRCL
ncbi:MAG TPA: glycosyltransferase family 39 protein [Pyrinomonadaceae bacterium]